MPNYKRIFAENHYIFITVVTFKRNPILIENIELLRNSFRTAKTHYNFEILGIVVLKDHFHMIIQPENIDEYPKIIAVTKWNFSKNIEQKYLEPIKLHFSPSNIKRNEKGVWQRRYFEHTIRDEKSLYKHLDYIHYNLVKHGYISNVMNWEFSSFSRFVRLGYYPQDWGTFEDIGHIQDIDNE